MDQRETFIFSYEKLPKRFESWPTCPRRVRYFQFRSQSGERTYGQFTFDAHTLGSALDVWFSFWQPDHPKARKLVNWLHDCDQHSDEVLDLPRQWISVESAILKHIKSSGSTCFCVACNRPLEWHEMKALDDGRELEGRGAQYFDRLLCPEGHLLIEVSTIRVCKAPSGIIWPKNFSHWPGPETLEKNLTEDGWAINSDLFDQWGYSAKDLEWILERPVHPWAPKTLKYQHAQCS